MFLAWNYTLELFFWVILGAVILVSLTILLAGPGFRSKKSETSEETLSLTGENVDSPEENVLDQDAASSGVEEEFEILEEIEKGEATWTRFGRWVGNIPIRLVRWVGNIPIRLVRWIRNIPTHLRRLGRWIRDLPARLVKWIRDLPARLVRGVRNILRFLRREWKAIVVGIGFCFYFGLVCVLGALIVLETLITYESIEITGEWGGIALETWIFRLALVFGGAIFLTGVVSAYSFLAENQKWSRYSCRATAIVLLLFIAFVLNVTDIDWPTDSPDTPVDDDQWWRWERDLETAGIASLYLIFASLLFSGDLKRIWRFIRKEWVAIVRSAEVCYSLCVCVFGILIFWEVTQSISNIPGSIFRTPLGNIGVFFSATIFLTGVACMLGFVTDNLKWSKYTCRVATFVLLLFSIFCLAVADGINNIIYNDSIKLSFLGILDIDITNVDMYGLHSWRNDFANAGIVSFYLIFASLLFSGDLKRIWKWMATSLTDISNENESKGVYARIFAYCLYSVFVVVVGGWGVIYTIYDILGSQLDIPSFVRLVFNTVLLGSGTLALYGSVGEKHKQLLIISCRVTALVSFFSVFILASARDYPFFNGEPESGFLWLVVCSLLFSGDLKRLWERILSNERIKQLMERYW